MGREARGRSLRERRSFRFASLEDWATPLMIVRYTHLKIASLEGGTLCLEVRGFCRDSDAL